MYNYIKKSVFVDYIWILFDEIFQKSQDLELHFSLNFRLEFPFEKLPVLELNDGRMLAESNAIARYLGIKFGSYIKPFFICINILNK